MIRLAGRTLAAEVAGDTRTGAAATLHVTAGGGDQTAGAAARAEVVAAFFRLARAGGLGGGGLNPARAAASNPPGGGPAQSAGAWTWQLPGLAVDPLAANVLCNLIECTRLVAPVTAVRLVAAGSDATPPTTLPDDYPAAHPAVPFAADVDLQGRNVSVEVEFGAPLTPARAAELVEGLTAWEEVLAAGGFRFADRVPWESGGAFAVAPAPAGDRLALDLEKVTAHPAAFDALLNVLARFALTTAPIVAVRIES